MNDALRRRGVISASSASATGSMAEKKIPEMPRSQAIITGEVDHAAHSVSTPKVSSPIPRTGRRPIRSASGGITIAPANIPTCCQNTTPVIAAGSTPSPSAMAGSILPKKYMSKPSMKSTIETTTSVVISRHPIGRSSMKAATS